MRWRVLRTGTDVAEAANGPEALASMRRIDLRTETRGIENHHLKVLYDTLMWNASSGREQALDPEGKRGTGTPKQHGAAGGSGAAHRARARGMLQQHAERSRDGSDCES